MDCLNLQTLINHHILYGTMTKPPSLPSCGCLGSAVAKLRGVSGPDLPPVSISLRLCQGKLVELGQWSSEIQKLLTRAETKDFFNVDSSVYFPN